MHYTGKAGQLKEESAWTLAGKLLERSKNIN